MEAMASNLFVLARYDHNLLDVIQDGETGFFFETEEEFSEKLHKVYDLYQKSETKLLKNALKSIDSYSIETFYERIIGAYKHAIKQCW
jgi:1,2-diacylglycerol 3-alpha-glucosyltransferase